MRPAAIVAAGVDGQGIDDVRDTGLRAGTRARAEGEAHTGTAGDAHAEARAGHEGAFPPFDPSTFPSQLLWLAITFGLFYLFLKKVVLPRIGGILEVARDRIAQDLDQAARMKGEADAAVAAYEQELAEAEGQGQRDRPAGARRRQGRGRRRAQEGRGRASTRSSPRPRRASPTIKATAMQEVGTIAEETAAAIVEQLIGGKVDKADDRGRRQAVAE